MDGKKNFLFCIKSLKIMTVLVFEILVCFSGYAQICFVNAGYYRWSNTSIPVCSMAYKVACPPGCYCPGGDKEVSRYNDISCRKGKFFDSLECAVGCTDEHYGVNACPQNYQNSAAGASGLLDCYLITSAGKYVARQFNEEISCPAGSYCPGGITVKYGSVGGQKACPGGSFSLDGASSCSRCPAGKVSKVDGTSCEPCPTGTYSKAGASSCTPCPAGTFASNLGSKSCTSCPSLTDGYVYDSATGLTSATQCKEYKDAGANGLTNCSFGRLVKTAHSATEWNAAVSEALMPKPGYGINKNGDDTSCVECEKGYYNIARGILQTSCAKCPDPEQHVDGYDGRSTITTDSTASTSPTQCYQTKTPENCLSGTIKRNITLNASLSKPYKWSDPVVLEKLTAKEGYVVDGTQCLPCPDAPEGWEKYYKKTPLGGTSWDYCKIKKTFVGCSGFVSRNAVNATEYSEDINSINLVAKAGYYKDISGNTVECKQCEPGTYSAKGATQCTPCNGGNGPTNGAHTECVECTQEEYIDSTEKICQQCPDRDKVNRSFYKFFKVASKEDVETCGIILKISGDGDDYDSKYKGEYSSCGEGTVVVYLYNKTKSTYYLIKSVINSGGQSIKKKPSELNLITDACVPCGKNEFNVNDACTKCTAGKYIENNQCKPCVAGYYCPLDKDGKLIDSNQITDYKCPKNYYSTDGAAQCEACPTGYITLDPTGNKLNTGPENCFLAPFVIRFSSKKSYEYPMLKGERLDSSVITLFKSDKYHSMTSADSDGEIMDPVYNQDDNDTTK